MPIRKSISELRKLLDDKIAEGSIIKPCDVCSYFGLAIMEPSTKKLVFVTNGFVSAFRTDFLEAINDPDLWVQNISDEYRDGIIKLLDSPADVITTEKFSLNGEKNNLFLTSIPLEYVRGLDKAKLLFVRSEGQINGNG